MGQDTKFKQWSFEKVDVNLYLVVKGDLVDVGEYSLGMTQTDCIISCSWLRMQVIREKYVLKIFYQLNGLRIKFPKEKNNGKEMNLGQFCLNLKLAQSTTADGRS